MHKFTYWLPLASTCLGATLGAQEQTRATSDVYERHAARVVKIQVVSKSSGAKATIGSGFFATPQGHVVTNYHVISNLINTPDRYRAELLDARGDTVEAKVVAIDAVHDLAVLETGLVGRPHFAIREPRIRQGARLFALGHPKDLGLSIVEGTYNGLLVHTLYQRIHFTGSLNPGMSGGPTIDRDGTVVGVNVSTEGNQVSFLVPVPRVIAVLARATAGDASAPALGDVASQLREHQDAYLTTIFDSTTRRIALGPFRVATQPAPFFRCWGDSRDDRDLPYETASHGCSTGDDIYLDADQTTGSVWIRHQLISTKTMNTARFFAAYTSLFSTDNAPGGDEEYLTNWKCVTRNVRTEGAPMRAVSCLRRYRKLGELYDSFLQVAVLGPRDTGLVTTLNVTGVTFENAARVSQRYLESITWR